MTTEPDRPVDPVPAAPGGTPGDVPADAPADARGSDEADVTSTLALPGLTTDESVDEPREAEAALGEPLPPGAALLVVKRGPNAGTRYLLEADVVTVGRHPESDVFLDDITVSRRHAQFLREAGGYRVKDVGSLNGTYVNRQRVDDVALSSGDEVQVGKYRLLYLVGRVG